MTVRLRNPSQSLFLKHIGLVTLVILAVTLVVGSRSASAAAPGFDYSTIKGFNYQPSYGSNGLELWENFDPAVIDKELGIGKKHFPKMNAIRYWLSWPAFLKDPENFVRKFETVLSIADKHGLKVMPVLYNTWHSGLPDYGGVYPKDFVCSPEERRAKFAPYVEAVVGPHADDPRIFAWDLCNEPQYIRHPPAVRQAESAWLQETYDQCKQLGAKAPLTVGMLGAHVGMAYLEHFEPISDILSIHPYWFGPGGRVDKATFEKYLDDCVALGQQTNKPVLATETCWGSLDDQKRVDNTRYTLGEFEKRGIGWLPYALYTSRVADLHGPELGPVGSPGNLAFIQLDGTLRPGHDVFNEFYPATPRPELKGSETKALKGN